MEQDMNMGAQTEEKKPFGAIISIIIIVLVLAYGAFYFLKQVPAVSENSALTPAEIQGDMTITDLSTQGTSTELSDIEADLNATDLSGIDAGLSDIEI